MIVATPTHRQVINQNFLSGVLVVEPHVAVRPEEQVDRDVPRQRVEGRLPEAGDDGSLALDGHDLGEETLGRVDGGMVDLKSKTSNV